MSFNWNFKTSSGRWAYYSISLSKLYELLVYFFYLINRNTFFSKKTHKKTYFLINSNRFSSFYIKFDFFFQKSSFCDPIPPKFLETYLFPESVIRNARYPLKNYIRKNYQSKKVMFVSKVMIEKTPLSHKNVI